MEAHQNNEGRLEGAGDCQLMPRLLQALWLPSAEIIEMENRGTRKGHLGKKCFQVNE